jgi:DNA-binding CsgD family transcriptional regulator
MYCSVIDGCQEAYAARRAHEWTAALTRWCEEQPDMVSFTGRCLVHRAEIMQMHGQWPGALEEVRKARERFERAARRDGAGVALYRQGELHRLRGQVQDAEGAYREASRRGCEPQPGLALLRLAQGKTDAAVAAIRRMAGETSEPVLRAGLLPAYVEIMIAAGDTEEARAAALELADIAGGYEAGMLDALVGQATGAVALAEGDAREALTLLRRSWQLWQELDAPYEGARVRVLVGLACRALGDDDAAALEFEAARAAFAELGAAPALAQLDGLTGSRPADHGLTARELQVLRLVAGGETNKAIAAQLVLSERTIDRHVSNILTKLRLSSRAAATAYAYEHDLV